MFWKEIRVLILTFSMCDFSFVPLGNKLLSFDMLLSEHFHQILQKENRLNQFLISKTDLPFSLTILEIFTFFKVCT